MSSISQVYADDNTAAASMTFTEHLEELRARIFKILLAVCLGMAVSYLYIDEIVAIITSPAGKLYYLRPAEAFFIYLKVGVVAGLVLASPLVFYQIWAFIMPALSVTQRLRLWLVVFSSVSFFLAGLLFAYSLVLPLGLKFFMGFDTFYVQPMISMESYIDFILMLILPFGVVAEMPLVLTLAACAGLVTSQLLTKVRPYVIFGIFVLAAIITPPDVVSQLLLALPMIGLYEAGLLFIRHILRK